MVPGHDAVAAEDQAGAVGIVHMPATVVLDLATGVAGVAAAAGVHAQRLPVDLVPGMHGAAQGVAVREAGLVDVVDDQVGPALLVHVRHFTRHVPLLRRHAVELVREDPQIQGDGLVLFCLLAGADPTDNLLHGLKGAFACIVLMIGFDGRIADASASVTSKKHETYEDGGKMARAHDYLSCITVPDTFPRARRPVSPAGC